MNRILLLCSRQISSACYLLPYTCHAITRFLEVQNLLLLQLEICTLWPIPPPFTPGSLVNILPSLLLCQLYLFLSLDLCIIEITQISCFWYSILHEVPWKDFVLLLKVEQYLLTYSCCVSLSNSDPGEHLRYFSVLLLYIVLQEAWVCRYVFEIMILHPLYDTQK